MSVIIIVASSTDAAAAELSLLITSRTGDSVIQGCSQTVVVDSAAIVAAVGRGNVRCSRAAGCCNRGE